MSDPKKLSVAEEMCFNTILSIWNRDLNMSIRIYDRYGNVIGRAGGLSEVELTWYMKEFARAPRAEFVNDRAYTFEFGNLQK